ncbi:FixH family protein [Bacillus sp. REN10]|uniref:FixH family protein n=1 Tax=Bacillus sp. REN10 TaxID=2782541 RepID=UPI00193C61DC|nr:FixH family protein [Bacillus sp. REN10]
MKKYGMIAVICSLFLLGACGQQKQPNENATPQPIVAELTVPEKAAVNEEVALITKVTQGEEIVSDADEVVYEVWQEGKKEDSEMIEAKKDKEENYIAKKTFPQDGIYHVQVHVTARGLHTMPKKPITIGQGQSTDSTQTPAETEEHQQHSDM